MMSEKARTTDWLQLYPSLKNAIARSLRSFAEMSILHATDLQSGSLPRALYDKIKNLF